MGYRFGHFEIVSDFVLRISNLLIALRLQPGLHWSGIKGLYLFEWGLCYFKL